MATRKNPQVAVEPRPGGKWAVQTDGTKRAANVYDRKADAVPRAIEVAKNKKTELVIKNKDGVVVEKNSYGPDSRKVKG